MTKRKKSTTVEKKHNKDIDNTNRSDSEHGDYEPGDDVGHSSQDKDVSTQTGETKDIIDLLKVSPEKRRAEIRDYLVSTSKIRGLSYRVYLVMTLREL